MSSRVHFFLSLFKKSRNKEEIDNIAQTIHLDRQSLYRIQPEQTRIQLTINI